MKFKGKVTKGLLILFDKKLFNIYIKTFEGKHIDLTIKKSSKIRSIPANSRHWARMTFAAKILGDRTPEELHYDFCSLFLTDRVCTPPRVRGSSELSTTEFSIWEQDIDRILGEQGIVVPEPEEK